MPYWFSLKSGSPQSSRHLKTFVRCARNDDSGSLLSTRGPSALLKTTSLPPLPLSIPILLTGTTTVPTAFTSVLMSPEAPKIGRAQRPSSLFSSATRTWSSRPGLDGMLRARRAFTARFGDTPSSAGCRRLAGQSGEYRFHKKVKTDADRGRMPGSPNTGTCLDGAPTSPTTSGLPGLTETP